MKLRQKLAAVMAASVVLTSVPVVTMADSSNSISIYNYNIKDTTVGFKTTSGNYQTTGCLYTNGNAIDGYQFVATNLPGLEISPENTYTLGGDASHVQQTAFVHLTKDSNFVEEAYLYFVDAYATTTVTRANTMGTTNMYFDNEGKARNTNHGTDWDGKTKSEIYALLAAGKSNNAPFTLYFDATGAITNQVTTTGVNITVMDVTEFTQNERDYKSTLRIDFFGTFLKGKVYKIPFLLKVGGDKEVLVYVDGKDSFVTPVTYTLTGKLTDKKLTATADSKTITVDSIEEIGEIRLEENSIKSLNNAEHKWIKIKLPSNSDLEFNLDKTKANIKATGKSGFYGVSAATYGTTSDKVEVKFAKQARNTNENDEQVLLVRIPDTFKDETARGQLVLTGIYVQPQDKKAKTGDVNVIVSEDLSQGGTGVSNLKPSTNLVDETTLKVATVAEYDITLTAEPIKVKAGRSAITNDNTIKFTLKEAVKDSLVSTRKIEFTLENGYMFGPADVEIPTNSGNPTNYVTTTRYKELAKARFESLVASKVIKFEEDAEAKDGKKGFELTDIEVDANGCVIGFTGYFDRLSETADNKLEITIPVATSVQSKGEVKLKASNLFTRTYKEDLECVVANIVEPINVEVEKAAIKVGLQNQTAGKVTIKETDKGMIERGWMFLSAEDLQDGITFDGIPTVEVKGEGSPLKIENVQVSKDKKVVAFEVTRTSTEASTIEISDIKFTADRTVPEANYDLNIWGKAITDEDILDVTSYNYSVLNSAAHRAQYTDMYVVEDFITMTTKNTQDITESGLKLATTTFKIGEKEFTVNGEKVTMDVASYVKDGCTMVPVKYVSKAFGIEGNAIQYDKATSTATIIAGSKAISITAGKAYIVVNGTQIPMVTKAEVKDGRMCVPMAYIAAALGVEKSWDASSKTATFTNEAK